MRRRDLDSKMLAFTLVELLVVVAVISILMSLLLPALRGARDKAQGLACAGNLKQVGLCFEMYSGDFGAYCPATYSGCGADPENGQWTIFDWTRSLWRYSVGELSQRIYNPYLPAICKTAFFCQAQPSTLGGGVGSGGTYQRYGLNANIFTAATGIYSASASGLLPNPYPSIYAQKPSCNVLCDEVLRSSSGDPWAFFPSGAGIGNIPHGVGSNFLFMDKHVEYRKYPSQTPVSTLSVAGVWSFWFGGS